MLTSVQQGMSQSCLRDRFEKLIFHFQHKPDTQPTLVAILTSALNEKYEGQIHTKNSNAVSLPDALD